MLGGVNLLEAQIDTTITFLLDLCSLATFLFKGVFSQLGDLYHP